MVSHASFANTEDLKSQLGYVITLADYTGSPDIVHYGCYQFRRVARSVMEAELQGLVLGFDFAFIIRQLLLEILGRKYALSRTQIVRSSSTLFLNKGLLQSAVLKSTFALRESYEKRDLSRIGWIPGSENISDALTKTVLSK